MATWNDQEAARLNQYLAEHPNIIAELKRRVPAIDTKPKEGVSMIEQAAISGARHAGAEDLLEALDDMRRTKVEPRGTGFIDPSAD